MLRVKTVLDGCADEELEGREAEEEGMMSQQMSASMATSMATEAEGRRAAGGEPEAGEVVQRTAPQLPSPTGGWRPAMDACGSPGLS
jgi:hypothetical protein